jgi:hypothetical protein
MTPRIPADPDNAVLVFRRLKVKATSFAVNGVPSDHSTPSRIAKVNTVLSSLNDHSVASHGWISLTVVL